MSYMKLLRVALRRETAMPMFALAFASGVCGVLVVARMVLSHKLAPAFLLWNLFLAWLPLVFALLAQEEFHRGSARSWHFGGLALAWLLFFPNAPYIFTDLNHLPTVFFARYWLDLFVILSCAMTGFILGFVSLYLMQGVVKRMAGTAASWLFIAGMAALSGFAVFLGRFLRFNSWDVLFRPFDIYHSMGSWVTHPFGAHFSVAFPALFATFLFIAYLMLYALTHLQQAQPLALRSNAGPESPI